MKTTRNRSGSDAVRIISGDLGFNPKDIKKDFPILSRKINGRRLVYLDSAATTQKPQSVIDALTGYYNKFNANVHRGLYTMSEEATSAYEATRDKVARFVGGVKREEIIFTRNATDSINIVMYSWGRKNIKKGDRIVITQMEHHANLVPWIMLAKEKDAELEYIPIDSQGRLNLSGINDIINNRTKLVAITQMSNVLGTINPVDEIIQLTHDKGARILIDGAQSVPHIPVDIPTLDADFFVFSAHKMLGPTGLGILFGKEEILNEMEPVVLGGEMINEVRFDYVSWAELPSKFEAGTPHIAGAVGFSPAIDYLSQIGMDQVRRHEEELAEYALDKMRQLDYLTIYGPMDVNLRGGTISFTDNKVHPHDLAQFLDSKGIAVRAGHHCAQPLIRLLGANSTARASFYIYNTKEDVDKLIDALNDTRRYFTNV
jgi:cysteine desulfurase/selenocysteine lyase